MSYFQGFGPPFHYNRFQGIDEDNDQGGRDESPATFGMEQGGTRAPGWISCQRHYGAAREEKDGKEEREDGEERKQAISEAFLVLKLIFAGEAHNPGNGHI
jgi:hypothetical protein